MKATSKGEQTKNRIIECAAELFLKNGYTATGINDILSVLKLPKGSFYYSFKSKKDLAIAVSNYYNEKTIKWILSHAEGKKWDDFVKSLIGEMIKAAEKERHFGCPFAVLGLEVSYTEPEISSCYSKSMDNLINVFQNILQFSGLKPEDAQLSGQRAFAIYEGYLLYFRVCKDISVFKQMRRDLLEI